MNDFFYFIMDYKKITINITPFESWLRDILISELGEIGYESFVEIDEGFEAYISLKNVQKENLDFIFNSFREDFAFSVSEEIIKSQNWNEVWEKNYFKPLLISGECVVRAPFHNQYPKAKYEIVIEPNMAFGTGNHETTSLVMEWILENEFSGKTVLDMGCGTGILGILASKKGAVNITAIDIDEWAFMGTRENTGLNNVTNINACMGDVSLLGNEMFDVIFANIHKNVLLNDMPEYVHVLKPGGKLIMSGFYEKDIDDIKQKAEQLGLTDKGFKSRNNWVAHLFQKQA